MPRAASKKPVDREFEPWELINWSKYGPHGAAKTLKVAAPCRVCGKPSYLLSPDKEVPMHKVCAEEFYLVKLLSPILVALGQQPESRRNVHERDPRHAH